jgi:hypothetical protein
MMVSSSSSAFLLPFFFFFVSSVDNVDSFSIPQRRQSRLCPVGLAVGSPCKPISGQYEIHQSTTFSGRSSKVVGLKLAAEDDDSTNSVDSPVDDANNSLEKKVEGRKKRLLAGYDLSATVFLAASLLHLFKRGFHSWSLYYIFGGGTFTVATTLYILKGAASHDRLNSDTYKRLNLSVISYSLLQLLMPVTSFGISEKLFFKGPALLALVNGMKGYGYGVLGWDKSKGNSAIMTDIKEGVLSTIQGMTKIKTKSIGYWIGTVLLGIMSAFKAKELLALLLFPNPETPTTPIMLLSRISRFARLGLLTSVMYTLKDASDRGRLNGTTFVQLNYTVSAAFLTMAFYLSPVGATPLGLLAGVMSVMTFFFGVTKSKK